MNGIHRILYHGSKCTIYMFDDVLWKSILSHPYMDENCLIATEVGSAHIILM